jgi:predicted nucleotidyltransferase
MSPVQTNLEEIVRLCRRYQVRRLAAFGSILRADFDSLRSDADFLVEFEPVPVAVRMQNYLALRDALASLLSRNVDLIEDGTIQNPYILRSVAQQQQVLYAA